MRPLARCVGAAIVLALYLVGCGPSETGRSRYGPGAALDPAPGAFPDRIILTWSGDPATSQSVTWRTDATVGKAFAEIAPVTAGPHFYKESVRTTAETTRLRLHRGQACYHAAVFTGLEPGALYAYRVGSDRGWSEWFHFRTAEGREHPFRFIYFGDAQNNVFAMWSRVIRAAYRQAPDARFMIHGGDLVSLGDSDLQWAGWFRAGAWINGMVPSIPAAGNHEYYSRRRDERTLTRHWQAQFTLPENGVPGLEESNYYLDYDGVRIVVLDSNRDLDPQTEWLRRVLSDRPQRWTIAVFHHPVYSAAKDRDNPELRALWKPVFDEYGVDLVLQGHDHTYARGTGHQAGDPAATGIRGPVYIVSVSGPKMYELPEDRWMDRAAEEMQLFQVISVDHDALHYAAYTVDGALFDEFDIVK